MKLNRYGPLIVLAVLLSLAVAFAEIEIPAPFCKAKDYAMTVPVDEDGDYVWQKDIPYQGEMVHYALVYLTEQKMILIGREPFACIYDERTGELTIGIFMGLYFVPVNKSPEEIIEIAFKVFGELVEANSLLTIT